MEDKIIFLFIYLLCVCRSLYWIRKAYSKDGRWSRIYATTTDLVLIFCPIVNLGLSIMTIFMNPLDSNYHPSYLERLAKKILNSK